MRRIAVELGVSVSSVSVWVRDLVPADSPQDASHQEEIEPPAIPAGNARQCGRCGRLLPTSAFNRSGDDYQWWCRECFRGYFQLRGDLHRQQTHAAQRRRRREARAFVIGYLAMHPCVDCGEDDPVVLEFDHLGPKRAHMARLVGDGYSVQALQKEIDMCEVVCVNCHRRRTAARGASWRLDPASLERNRTLLPSELRNLALVRDVLLQSDCIDCGRVDLIVLEFDHMGNKKCCVPLLARRGCSLARLKEEVAKCQIRCANCHRRKTVSEHTR